MLYKNSINNERNDKMNRVKVKIYNREYALQTDESLEYTTMLAKKLDSQIVAMMTGAQAASLVDASILVALSALDASIKANDNIDNIRTQIKDYVDDAGQARLKVEQLEHENAGLKAEIEKLKKIDYSNK